jgi:hypothetical protein
VRNMLPNFALSTWRTSVPAGLGTTGTPAAPGATAAVRNRNELNGLATAGFRESIHGAKSVLRSEKRDLCLRNISTKVDGYQFGTPVGSVAPRIGARTGVPPRSKPV